MIRLVVALLALYATSAHSEYLYGITGNMAGAGHTWGMNIGPSGSQSLKINGVFYQYTPVKNTEDDMVVHVRNKRFGTNEYIFSSKDDWSGLQGGIPITRGFIIDNLPIELWGDGSIDIEGTGSVTDANVVYSYKYNNDCLTPMSDPSCSGYTDAVLSMMGKAKVDGYDPLGDENIANVMDEKVELEEDLEQDEDEGDDGLEKILSSVDDSVLSANVIAQNLLMFAMTNSLTMNTYYAKQLAGGTYKETVVLDGGELPDNKKGARAGLAQQILHTKMVSSQYDKTE